MKTKTVSLIFLAFLLLPLFSAGSANAGYSYYIPDIDGSATNPYPETEYFDWVSRVYYYETAGGTATYDGTYTATNNTFQIEVRMYAPDTWTTGTTSTSPPDADYTTGTYQQQNDPEHVAAETWVNTSLPDQNFDNVYSYFYQITNIGDGIGTATTIDSLSIPYNPADVKGYGFVNDSDGDDPISMDASSNTELALTFSGIAETNSSEWFFMTSESWWGWQDLTYNGSSASGSTEMASWTSHSSPSGGIPAPNPEAPVVALYIVGLMGTVGFTYMRKRQGSAF